MNHLKPAQKDQWHPAAISPQQCDQQLDNVYSIEALARDRSLCRRLMNPSTPSTKPQKSSD